MSIKPAAAQAIAEAMKIVQGRLGAGGDPFVVREDGKVFYKAGEA
ncbi:hypothetical protein [Bradyrhizobium rifense]|nr:hypothetical protein [Bradyrhizobium rifense]